MRNLTKKAQVLSCFAFFFSPLLIPHFEDQWVAEFAAASVLAFACRPKEAYVRFVGVFVD